MSYANCNCPPPPRLYNITVPSNTLTSREETNHNHCKTMYCSHKRLKSKVSETVGTHFSLITRQGDKV